LSHFVPLFALFIPLHTLGGAALAFHLGHDPGIVEFQRSSIPLFQPCAVNLAVSRRARKVGKAGQSGTLSAFETEQEKVAQVPCGRCRSVGRVLKGQPFRTLAEISRNRSLLKSRTRKWLRVNECASRVGDEIRAGCRKPLHRHCTYQRSDEWASREKTFGAPRSVSGKRRPLQQSLQR